MARRLQYADRKKYEALYNAGVDMMDIAAALGISRFTVYRELERGTDQTLDANGRYAYSADRAQKHILDHAGARGRKAHFKQS